MELKEASGIETVYHTRLDSEVCVCSIKGTEFEMEIYNALNAWEAKSQCIMAYRQQKDDASENSS